jgi:Fe-S cluster biogenesis protein NfuA
MEIKASSVVAIFTEQTPNPETLKFVSNRLLFRGVADFITPELAQQWSPIAHALMELPYVKSVYISNNFLTITKEANYQWEDIMLLTKQFITEFIQNGGEIILEGYDAWMAKQKEEENRTQFSGKNGEIAQKVKDLIDSHVKPAVEMDGGNIEFKSFENGIVYVIMQGACSGCPSSTVTLKAGIEGMLKRMIPEVQEVVQEMG